MVTHLALGQSGAVRIESRRKWNVTDIELVKGQTYYFEATGEWRDAGRRCGPDGYPSPNWILRSAEHCRRVPGENWLSLIGSLDCNPLTAFVIGKSKTIAVIDTGVLTCFANDVAFMYWNNSGNLNLQITRVL